MTTMISSPQRNTEDAQIAVDVRPSTWRQIACYAAGIGTPFIWPLSPYATIGIVLIIVWMICFSSSLVSVLRIGATWGRKQSLSVLEIQPTYGQAMANIVEFPFILWCARCAQFDTLIQKALFVVGYDAAACAILLQLL